MSSQRTVLFSATALCAVGLLGYAIYFDYRRRNDVEFRKQLRREQKKISSKRTRDKLAEPVQSAFENADLRTALTQLRKEPLPTTRESQEAYLMENLGKGEQLALLGPAYRLESALSFYRALRVAPPAANVNFFQIIESTQPPEVFKLLMELVTLDVKARIDGYYDVFPPKDMNVKTFAKEIGKFDADDTKLIRRVLIAERDFKAGEVIYKENPVLATLDPDLVSLGSHCAQCLRVVVPGMSLQSNDDSLASSFCSRDCQIAAQSKYRKLMFSLEPPVSEVASEISDEMVTRRKKAQEAFVEFLKDRSAKFRSYTYLTAQFIATFLMEELGMLPSGGRNILTSNSASDYSLSDHLERMRFLELTDLEGQFKLVADLFSDIMPGLQQVLSLDRFKVLAGKIAYNTFGVSYSGGRDDKPESLHRPEDQERTRTPHGTERQIGSAFYLTSSYLSHSCLPNARVSFPEGTSRMSVIAMREIKKGDELAVAYVDVSQHDGETVDEARRRRRMEIARGWRMACPCNRCSEELPSNEQTDGRPELRDESKVEDTIKRYEEGKTGPPLEVPLD